VCRMTAGQIVTPGRLNRICSLALAMLIAVAESSASGASAVGCPVSGAPAATIPFTVIGDHIYTNGTVNGTGPYRFIVDTGGVNLIDTGLVKPLSLKITGSEMGHGVGAEAVESGKTTIHQLKIGDATFTDQKFYTFDFHELYRGGGVEIAGMVGASLFRQYVMCVDFSRQVIELIDSARFDLRDAGTPLRMSMKDSEITISGRFDGAPGIFEIDTGSSATLTLNSPFVARHKLLGKFSKQVETLSSGVGGSTQAFTVRGRSLVLGSTQIDNPITKLSVSSKGQLARRDLDGTIGIGALKRYIVTFDFPGKRLFLKPYQPAPADLDTYDRSGLGIEIEPAGFRVVSVGKGTPAAEAGLHLGDVIVAVDGQAAAGITLPAMRDQLRESPAGAVVTLGIKSEDKVRSVRLTLRDLL
jgi:hypothetical protein